MLRELSIYMLTKDGASFELSVLLGMMGSAKAITRKARKAILVNRISKCCSLFLTCDFV